MVQRWFGLDRFHCYKLDISFTPKYPVLAVLYVYYKKGTLNIKHKESWMDGQKSITISLIHHCEMSNTNEDNVTDVRNLDPGIGQEQCDKTKLLSFNLSL